MRNPGYYWVKYVGDTTEYDTRGRFVKTLYDQTILTVAQFEIVNDRIAMYFISRIEIESGHLILGH